MTDDTLAQNEHLTRRDNAAMNIRNLNLSAERPENYRQPVVRDAAKSGPEVQNASAARHVSDRVEISGAARAAVNSGAGAGEINLARKALLGIPPLSEKRASDVLARVQSGYYSQPDVLRQIAERVGDALRTGDDPR